MELNKHVFYNEGVFVDKGIKRTFPHSYLKNKSMKKNFHFQLLLVTSSQVLTICLLTNYIARAQKTTVNPE